MKCDIKKFFNSIDHGVLKEIIFRRVKDEKVIWLINEIIDSFEYSTGSRKGLPIGNLTSQLFCNIYMNEFDQFVKHELKVKHYARYTDDFVFLSHLDEGFDQILVQVELFLTEKLELVLHERKVIKRTLHQWIDFLGYVIRPYNLLIRTKTKKRIFKKFKNKIMSLNNGSINKDEMGNSLSSFLGVLSHANAHKISQELKNKVWFDS